MNLEKYLDIQNRTIKTVPLKFKRSLYKEVPWQKRMIGIYGPRGVGKTTMILQYCAENLKFEDYLYLSGDNPFVSIDGIYNIGDAFFKYGGKTLIVDEVHQIDHWAGQVKALYDAFPSKKIVFSGSSSYKLLGGNVDLSRRVLFFKLDILSFREFVNFRLGTNFSEISLEDMISKHVEFSREIQEIEPLKYFREYLRYGCFPVIEEEAYLYKRLMNIIDKSLYEDVAGDIKNKNVSVLKKIIAFFATSTVPTISPQKLSNDLDISKNTLYHYLDLIERAGLMRKYLPFGLGKKKIRSGEKVFLSNTNFYFALFESQWKQSANIGTLREAFFASQADFLGIEIPERADFVVKGQYFFEIGGKTKTTKQISGLDNAWLLKDDIEIGFGKHLPLYLAGFLR
jgi:predicted AAA+ superfamily ATPase